MDPTELQDGDLIFTRVWNQTTAIGGGTFADSARRIEIEMFPRPRPTLFDAGVGHVFCPGDSVQFDVIPNDAHRYMFYRNGILLQDSSQTTLTTILDHLDEIRVDVYSIEGCVGSSSLQMFENQVESGGQIGFAGTATPLLPVYICHDSSPPSIESHAAAVYGGVPLLDDDHRYEWYSSIDGVIWDALDHHEATYAPSALVTTSFFKRDLSHTLSGTTCNVASNILQVVVSPPSQGGTARNPSQMLCSGDVPMELIIDNGMNGPGISYQWQESTDGVVFTDIDVYGNSERYQPPALNQSTFYRRLTTIQMANCEAFSEIIAIEVISVDPGVLDPNQSQTLCFGDLDTFILDDTPLNPGNPGQPPFTDDYTTLTYQWEFSRNGGIQWDPVPNGNLKSLHLEGPWTETIHYRRRVIGSASNVDCTEHLSLNEIQIEVQAEIGAALIDGPKELCENAISGTLTLTAIDIIQPLSIQWQSSTDGLNFNAIAGER